MYTSFINDIPILLSNDMFVFEKAGNKEILKIYIV